MASGPYRILVVEDERVVAADLCRRVQRLGHEVVGVVETAGTALAAVRRLRPDLVLMDIGLSGPQDGIDATRRIRAEARVPVVYVTASSEPETLERAKGTEPEGYLLKPASTADVELAIEFAVHRHRRELERRSPGSQDAGAGWCFTATRAVLETPRGTEVPLTSQEAIVLSLLTARPGEHVRRQTMFEALDYPDDQHAHARLEALISRLRRKVRRLDPASELPVRARHSLGYAFLAETSG